MNGREEALFRCCGVVDLKGRLYDDLPISVCRNIFGCGFVGDEIICLGSGITQKVFHLLMGVRHQYRSAHHLKG